MAGCRMWSPAVRAEVGPPPSTKLQCEVPPEGDAAAVRTGLPALLARFDMVPVDWLPLYTSVYIEMVHGYIQFPLGVAFLEQCILAAPLSL